MQNAKPPASLYFGKVMHTRLKPKLHRFSYKVFSLLIDLDELENASRMAGIFSTNRANLVSFHEKDHGLRDGSPLRSYVEKELSKAHIAPPNKIFLWCNPRILGYTFNPLSIYYCENAEGETTALIYQVHNTFGENHSYVAIVDQKNQVASLKNSAPKRFYVSPFMGMDMRYDFTIHPPDERLKVKILEYDSVGMILSATFSGKFRRLNSFRLTLGILSTFGLTWKIIAGIHYEALWLWLKGVRLRQRPIPPSDATVIVDDREHVPGE